MFKELHRASLHMRVDEYRKVYEVYDKFVADMLNQDRTYWQGYDANAEERLGPAYDAYYEAPQI